MAARRQQPQNANPGCLHHTDMRIAKSTNLARLLRFQDALLAMVTFVGLAHALHWWTGIPDGSLVRLLILSPVALIFGLLCAQFSHRSLHGRTVAEHLKGALRYVGALGAGLIVLGVLADIEVMTRRFLISYCLLLLTIIVVNRLFLHWWYLVLRREHEENFVKILIIGTGNRAKQLMREYREHSEWGIKVVGLLDPDRSLTGTLVEGVKVLGPVESIHQILAEEVLDEVIIALPRSLISDLENVVLACQEQAVCLNYMADFYDMKTERVSVEQIGRVPLLRFEPVAQDESKLLVKRIFDLVITIASLPVVLPLFLLIGVLIKLDSPGPVFFKQERVGLNKRPFFMRKFRSMCVDAEAKLKEIEHLNEADGPIFKMQDDPRVTRMGRFMRKTSIDELPQIFNVLLGEMSLIGPRPMSRRDVDLFSSGIQRRRFSVRPGLLCLREVSGRSELTFERWLELDLQYIDQWTLWLDVKILFRAIPAVLRGSGAV